MGNQTKSNQNKYNKENIQKTQKKKKRETEKRCHLQKKTNMKNMYLKRENSFINCKKKEIYYEIKKERIIFQNNFTMRQYL